MIAVQAIQQKQQPAPERAPVVCVNGMSRHGLPPGGGALVESARVGSEEERQHRQKGQSANEENERSHQ
jgi:hypothetical protein